MSQDYPDTEDRRKILEANLKQARTEAYGYSVDLAIAEGQEGETVIVRTERGLAEMNRLDRVRKMREALGNAKRKVRVLEGLLRDLPEEENTSEE